MKKQMVKAAVPALVVLACAGSAFAADFPEVEPNTSKAEATAVTMAPGDTISGSAVGETDTFRIKTVTAPAGIYKYTLRYVGGTTGITVTLRGLSQSSAGVIDAASDTTVQTGVADGADRVVAWYGFGKQEEVYFRVVGAATASGTYTCTLSREAVTPGSIATALPAAGPYVFRVTMSGATTDPEIWIYNADTLEPIPDYNNDDTPGTGGGLLTTLARTFAAGRYYLAVSDYNLMTNLPSPIDENGRGEPVMDFPNVIANGDNNTGTTTANISIYDGTYSAGVFSGAVVASATSDITGFFANNFLEFRVGNSSTCVADFTDAGGSGTPDGGVTIEDLLFYLDIFSQGVVRADVDNGTGTGTTDGGVAIEDLLYFLQRFADGC